MAGLAGLLVKSLSVNQFPLIVIEKDERVRQQLEQDKILYLDFDATHEKALIEAGVERAKGLVTVVQSDPENVYICLTARGLNSQLYILSRAEDEANERKLLQAGANKVILPYMIGGRRMFRLSDIHAYIDAKFDEVLAEQAG